MYVERGVRAKIGKQMDEYLRTRIQDEEVLCDTWLTYGMPDAATDNYFDDLVEDDEFWIDCLEVFVKALLLDAEE